MKKLFSFLVVFLLLFSLVSFGYGQRVNVQAINKYVQMFVNADLTQSDVSGLQLPKIRGTWYWVDPTSGNNARDGKTISNAVLGLDDAYALCTDGAGDGIVLLSRGSTAAATTSLIGTELAWSKNGITTVGVCAPTFYNQRARVSDSTGVDLANIVTVSGANNTFINILFINEAVSKTIQEAQFSAVKVTGIRNAFINCHFISSPDSATALKSDLVLNSADENLFSHCTFGSASFDAGDNASCHIFIDGTTGNGQNMFEGCISIAQVSTGTAFGVVKCGNAKALNGLIIFRDCIFAAWQANTGLVAMASWFIGTKPTTGAIVVHNSLTAGYAEWDTVAGNDRVIVGMPTTAASAGGGLGTIK